MFTGLVQDIGIVRSVFVNLNSIRMSILTKLDECHLNLGASIACNGCCLTVVEFYKDFDTKVFVVEIGYQTLAHTNFKLLNIGSYINLEPAIRIGDPMGGHHVTGHIDTLCNIISFNKIDQEFWKLTLQIPGEFSSLIFQKGCIAVAGISLTIANVLHSEIEDTLIEIMIIPHTFRNTILQYIAEDKSIEVEFDQTVKAIASVVENMLPSYIQARK